MIPEINPVQDQSKRRAQIHLLEIVVAKNQCAIREQEHLLQNMREKQVNRLAELRLQKLLLVNANRRAARGHRTIIHQHINKGRYDQHH